MLLLFFEKNISISIGLHGNVFFHKNEAIVPMANSLNDAHMQGIIVVVFIKTNIPSKKTMMGIRAINTN